jgi:hypothetical protein
MSNDVAGPAGFEADIKPLFRERDRRAMLSRFDLWSYDDVSRDADSIHTRLKDGTMPCDGAWPPGSDRALRTLARGRQTTMRPAGGIGAAAGPDMLPPVAAASTVILRP